ncbi:hypothetical protein [Actinophytocola sp.]|uniref:hypothetical protein n=1 Tax=Actinophytocola sp. TaxID=1872138 RepID=UPI002DDD6782|nr:hypothetical protein [Actinophytocola sp.]
MVSSTPWVLVRAAPATGCLAATTATMAAATPTGIAATGEWLTTTSSRHLKLGR